MSRYLVSPAAQADLEQIWDYTCDRWGVDQAEEYLRELQCAIVFSTNAWMPTATSKVLPRRAALIPPLTPP